MATQQVYGLPTYPSANLDKTGVFAISDPVIESTSIEVTDHTILLDVASFRTPVTISLPTQGVPTGKIYFFKFISGDVQSSVVIDPGQDVLIEDSITFAMTGKHTSLSIQYDGTNWWIISSYQQTK